MTEAEWDKLLPEGMQWVTGREIVKTDTMITEDGSHLTALEFEGCKNTWKCIRACCPIVPASTPTPLTDHAKYCRLSKQTGGLCAIYRGVGSAIVENSATIGCGYKFQYTESIKEDWTQCPRPSKQQPVELPKDPLEGLIDKLIVEMNTTYKHDKVLIREFAEKVRVL